MDPIDPPQNSNKTEVTEDTDKVTDLTSTLFNFDNSAAESANTSKEVQDILGEFTAGAGAPALPPKTSTASQGQGLRPSR